MSKLGDGFRDDDLVVETLEGIGLGVLEGWGGRDAEDWRAVGERCC